MGIGTLVCILRHFWNSVCRTAKRQQGHNCLKAEKYKDSSTDLDAAWFSNVIE